MQNLDHLAHQQRSYAGPFAYEANGTSKVFTEDSACVPYEALRKAIAMSTLGGADHEAQHAMAGIARGDSCAGECDASFHQCVQAQTTAGVSGEICTLYLGECHDACGRH